MRWPTRFSVATVTVILNKITGTLGRSPRTGRQRRWPVPGSGLIHQAFRQTAYSVQFCWLVGVWLGKLELSTGGNYMLKKAKTHKAIISVIALLAFIYWGLDPETICKVASESPQTCGLSELLIIRL
ncbi:hypothetical protein UY734_20225 [Escherichia coli]|nr:hypothetical protein [Escherichia coli]